MRIKIKSIVLFNILFCLIISCNAKTSPLSYDTTINGEIKLRNSVSVERNLGDLIQKLDTYKDLPDIYFKSKSGSEYLRLVFFPGDVKNAFSLFEVSKNIDNNQNVQSSSFISFATENGIKLGILKAEVIKRKGKDYKETKSGKTTKLRYEVDQKKDKKFLNRYNMPLYFAEYIFQNNVLVKFTFGFEYP